jgi:hypothetical protein
MPLAAAVVDYQKHRVKKLQGRSATALPPRPLAGVSAVGHNLPQTPFRAHSKSV